MKESTATQLKKVKNVSNGIRALLQIARAFWGVGMAAGLLGIVFSQSIGLTVGNGEFLTNFHIEQARQSGQEPPQLVINLHKQERQWGLFIEAEGASSIQTPLVIQPSLLLRIGIGVMMLLNALVTLNMLAQLAKLFTYYSDGEIFSIKVVNRIQKVGIALLGFPLMALINSYFASALVSQLTPESSWFDISVKFDTFLAALLVIMFSWIMDVGRQLREESELTI